MNGILRATPTLLPRDRLALRKSRDVTGQSNVTMARLASWLARDRMNY